MTLDATSEAQAFERAVLGGDVVRVQATFSALVSETAPRTQATARRRGVIALHAYEALRRKGWPFDRALAGVRFALLADLLGVAFDPAAPPVPRHLQN